MAWARTGSWRHSQCEALANGKTAMHLSKSATPERNSGSIPQHMSGEVAAEGQCAAEWTAEHEKSQPCSLQKTVVAPSARI